jgi:hypothetical protein
MRFGGLASMQAESFLLQIMVRITSGCGGTLLTFVPKTSRHGRTQTLQQTLTF